MDWEAILKRIEQGEDDHTEFKRGPGDLKPVGRSVAAFANTDGGVIILGVNDAGQIVGVQESPEETAERLTAFLDSGTSMPVQARLQRQEDPRGWVIGSKYPGSADSSRSATGDVRTSGEAGPVSSRRPAKCRTSTIFSVTF